MRLTRLYIMAAAGVAIAVGAAGADIKIQGQAFGTTAFIRTNGRVENAAFRTLGYVRPEGRIEDARFRALGYLRDGHEWSYCAAARVRVPGETRPLRIVMIGAVHEDEIDDEEDEDY